MSGEGDLIDGGLYTFSRNPATGDPLAILSVTLTTHCFIKIINLFCHAKSAPYPYTFSPQCVPKPATYAPDQSNPARVLPSSKVTVHGKQACRKLPADPNRGALQHWSVTSHKTLPLPNPMEGYLSRPATVVLFEGSVNSVRRSTHKRLPSNAPIGGYPWWLSSRWAGTSLFKIPGKSSVTPVVRPITGYLNVAL